MAPQKMNATRLDPLRDVGLSDAGVLDATQIVSYFNYINRVADALGVPPESDWDLKHDL